MGSKRVALIVNLGSPDSTETKDVKKYLDEFLMDERVIDLPYWKRALLVKGIILNFRPKKSAKAYQKIWWDEGSPLIVISKRLQQKAQALTDIPIYLGMRYGNPSINDTIQKIKDENPFLTEILLIPLYPHYAMSSYETVEVKVREAMPIIGHDVALTVMPPFYNSKAYIKLLSDKIGEHHPENYDQILFSYHGIPERHVRKTDPSGEHCLVEDDCCEKEHPCQAFCYRHQTFKMTDFVNANLQLPESKVQSSFQSRLGNDPWLQPFTDKRLESLPSEGVKKLMVVCPAFVSDCLETLEEIEMEGREEFLHNGGEEFKMVPCLNDDDEWAALLAQWITDFDPKKSLSEANTF
ncbi:ferrochelatase [Portibacter lacus]|uniref:Ferrochelatase n=1 Tax=Portibacter lacus TaxID=1099794 RepID=A0AA37SUL1_9BACT|nr:ferrochelatase [Portibacter lacus]GLR19116.1 ferrochelatase [Portibacter lacus]